MGNPAAYFDSNVGRPLRLLDALVESDVAHVVFSSSAAVYRDPSTVPIPESHLTDPTNPYGLTKSIFDGILSDYDAAYGVRSVSLPRRLMCNDCPILVTTAVVCYFPRHR